MAYGIRLGFLTRFNSGSGFESSSVSFQNSLPIYILNLVFDKKNIGIVSYSGLAHA